MDSNDDSSVSVAPSTGESPQDEAPEPEPKADKAPSPRPPAEFDGTLKHWVELIRKRRDSDDVGEELPLLPASPPPPTGEGVDTVLHSVRGFQRGDPGFAEDLETPGDDVLPALLHPFRDPARVRYAYPLFLFPPDETTDGRLFLPLAELLGDLVAGFAPGDEDARILKDNFARIERRARNALLTADGPVDAAPCLAKAGKVLQRTLSLSRENRQRLQEDLDKLIDALPEGGRLLGLGEHAPIHLFLLAARHHAALRRQCDLLRHRLRDLLLVDDKKEPEGRQPDALKGTLGPEQSALVDEEVFSKLVGPMRGTELMAPERRRRITDVLALLEEQLNRDEAPHITVVYRGGIPAGWKSPEADWRAVQEANVCNVAVAFFDEQAAAYARLFAAIRIAQLELADAYDPQRHDVLLKGFDWEAFSRDELLAMPPVLALETAVHLAGSGMIGLSRLLLSGRPVQVIVPIQPAMNPGLSSEDDPLMGYRFELAYLGISHREALVHQSAAARPEHLMAGFTSGLDAVGASLHVIASGLTSEGRGPQIGAWLQTGAALEGRAHPLFHYDPESGPSWAHRLDFDSNPQPEADWPLYSLPCRTADDQEQALDVAFTFADYVLLEQRYRRHFRIIPDDWAGEDLIPLVDYLALSADESMRRIPFIWGADGEGRLRRLVVSRRLAFACRDRLDFWHTLQELCGIRSEHVRLAVQRERERLEAQFAEERTRLADEHAAELGKVRTELATEALSRLAAGLLNADPSTLAAARAGAPAMPAPSAPSAPPAEKEQEKEGGAPAEAPAEEEEDLGPQEPWIDSFLCTSCNDCLNLNNRMFVYNSNRQATISDPSAGTFADLVQAAEKCPSRCIHPGTPLNPDEPNLDELIARARKFN